MRPGSWVACGAETAEKIKSSKKNLSLDSRDRETPSPDRASTRGGTQGGGRGRLALSLSLRGWGMAAWASCWLYIYVYTYVYICICIYISTTAPHRAPKISKNEDMNRPNTYDNSKPSSRRDMHYDAYAASGTCSARKIGPKLAPSGPRPAAFNTSDGRGECLPARHAT